MLVAHYLTSPLLSAAGFRHAFFTRHHGWSTGPFATLNFSVSVGDAEHNVAQNHGLAAAQLGVLPEQICCATQAHGRRVLVLEASARSAEVAAQEADALVSIHPGLACGVRTADCIPILLADRISGAVAAVHAGWRGVVGGVVTAAVEQLRAAVGDRGALLAAIGPHISSAAFEVSEELAVTLRDCAPTVEVVSYHAEAPHVDLGRIVCQQLCHAGIPRVCVDRVGGCTASDPGRYFSYRRDGARSGRHLSAIVASARQ
ncbi:MAG: peptidoglycan editing factor PgeF [Polyangiaceae bacterium]|nr:peptidoglycan editing factor PgeF [Polyangiaceae bacterium]